MICKLTTRHWHENRVILLHRDKNDLKKLKKFEESSFFFGGSWIELLKI